MKKLILIAVMVIGFSGCMVQNNLRKEIGSWTKVSIEKNDGLIISKEIGDTEFKWKKEGSSGTITELEMEKYLIKNILIGK